MGAQWMALYKKGRFSRMSVQAGVQVVRAGRVFKVTILNCAVKGMMKVRVVSR